MQHPKGEEPPFAKGDRIRLVSMTNDPDPIEPGAEGTVELPPGRFQDAWQVVVKWDNGRSLSLVVPPDVAEKIEPTQSRTAESSKQGSRGPKGDGSWTVVNELPDPLPVTEADVEAIERHFGAMLDEVFDRGSDAGVRPPGSS